MQQWYRSGEVYYSDTKEKSIITVATWFIWWYYMAASIGFL